VTRLEKNKAMTEQGTKEGFSTWELGRLDGLTEYYYRNGALEQRTNYKDGIPTDSAIFLQEGRFFKRSTIF